MLRGSLAALSSGLTGLARPAVPHRSMASLRAARASKSVPVPNAFRKPFQQTNRRRDDVFLERMMPAVPDTSKALQAWVSSWDEPRVGITELPAEVWGLPPRPDIVNNVVLWQRACRRLGLATSKGRAEVSGGGLMRRRKLTRSMAAATWQKRAHTTLAMSYDARLNIFQRYLSFSNV